MDNIESILKNRLQEAEVELSSLDIGSWEPSEKKDKLVDEIDDIEQALLFISSVSERVFTFDQMMDVITEFATHTNTGVFYAEGNDLKKELIPHIKMRIEDTDSDR